MCLVKEGLDLTPQLRELDEKVEHAERALRKTIIDTLNNNVAQLPEHVRVKVEERIRRAAQKNAALDIEQYSNLDGMMEFFDLRELQEAMTAKATWSLFETKFNNKDTLTGKFSQLAELRNSIRHSRTVDEITKKEGEAAVLWFGQVLKK